MTRVRYRSLMESGVMELGYRLPKARREWALGEETIPESVVHGEAAALLRAILAWWARGKNNMHVARNLAVRWDEAHPQAIEVVSEINPRKDYDVASEKYAASGTRELWVFDPLLSGPTTHGGPHRSKFGNAMPTTALFVPTPATDRRALRF
jgi:hypothetical protein